MKLKTLEASFTQKEINEDDLQILRQAMVEDDGTRISHREVFKKFGTKVSNSFNLCNIKCLTQWFIGSQPIKVDNEPIFY